MDPVTHVIVAGIASAIVAPQSIEPWAVAAATGAAILPDFDFLTRHLGHLSLLKFHGTTTHSLAGVTAIAALWGGVLAIASGVGWPVLAGFALLGGLSHLVLDLTVHQKGLALFWPFSTHLVRNSLFVGLNVRASPRCGERRLTICAMCQARIFAASPLFLISTGTALLALAAWPWRREVAIAGAIGLVAFFVAQLGFKARARRLAATVLGASARVYPASYSGTRWLAAAPRDEGWATAVVDLRRHDVGTPLVHVRAPADMVEKTAGREDVGIVVWKSVIPFAELSPDGRGVWWRDLSYDHDPTVHLFVMKIEFDDRGAVSREEFRERW